MNCVPIFYACARGSGDKIGWWMRLAVALNETGTSVFYYTSPQPFHIKYILEKCKIDDVMMWYFNEIVFGTYFMHQNV